MKTNNFGIFAKENWFDMRYDGRNKLFRNLPMSREEFKAAQRKAIHRKFFTSPYEPKSLLRRSYEAVIEWAKPEHNSYQKIVIYGHTNLYLCSPVYGHSDYNKSRLMPIKGNERECEFLLRVSNRVSSKKKKSNEIQTSN